MKKKNIKETNDFFYLSYNSHFSHTKIFNLKRFKIYDCFLIFLIFTDVEHLKID